MANETVTVNKNQLFDLYDKLALIHKQFASLNVSTEQYTRISAQLVEVKKDVLALMNLYVGENLQ